MSARKVKATREQVMAQMALGVPEEEAGLSEMDTEQEAPEKEEVPAKEPTTQSTETQAQATSLESSADLMDDYRKTLKANAKLEVQVETLTGKLEASETRNEALKTEADSASTVIRTCVERLSVALNTTVGGLDSMSLSALCNQFNQLNTQFNSKFKAGGVSRPLEKTEIEQKTSNNEFVARVNAARNITKRN